MLRRSRRPADRRAGVCLRRAPHPVGCGARPFARSSAGHSCRFKGVLRAATVGVAGLRLGIVVVQAELICGELAWCSVRGWCCRPLDRRVGGVVDGRCSLWVVQSVGGVAGGLIRERANLRAGAAPPRGVWCQLVRARSARPVDGGWVWSNGVFLRGAWWFLRGPAAGLTWVTLMPYAE